MNAENFRNFFVEISGVGRRNKIEIGGRDAEGFYRILKGPFYIGN
jgi:hypothetical protein